MVDNTITDITYLTKNGDKKGVVDSLTVRAVENILHPTTLASLWNIRFHNEAQGTSQLESFHAELSRKKIFSSSHESWELVSLKVGAAILIHNRACIRKVEKESPKSPL